MWILSTGQSPSVMTAPGWVPCMITGPARQPAQMWALYGLQLFSGHIHLMQLSVDICSTVVPHGLQGDNLCNHVFFHGLEGNLCSSAWSTSSPSFLTEFGVCIVVSLTFSYSFWFQLLHSLFFSLFLNVTTEVSSASLMGSALAMALF